MKEPVMHFDGPVWKPPYEATLQLLQVTARCTWHRCKFCTFYGKQRFRMSPISEIEDDLKVIHQFQPRAHRIFLTGANPFVLTVNRLTDIALLIRKLLLSDKTFARKINGLTSFYLDDFLSPGRLNTKIPRIPPANTS